MTYDPTQNAMLATRPITERVADEVCDALRAAQTVLGGFWRKPAPRIDDSGAYDSVAHLSEHVLKDIGAPHWVVARASAQREARQLMWVGMDFR